jgi:hypothetical protein
MATPITRRAFAAQSARAGALAGLGNFAFLKALAPVTAQEVRVSPRMVRLSPDVEPLVRLLEETDRGRLLEEVATRVRRGTTYGQLLAAVMLAGVRGIQPRPVGFKFHAVLVVNSAHLAALGAPDQERWLPLFWAIDNFKASQEQNRQQGDWVMAPPEEGKLPPAHHARQRFVEAMNDWDETAADRAVVAFVRNAGAADIIETLWRFGARDFRDIGHKAIYTANAWRTLQVIGWRHAEPVLRSLAYALLEHEGDNPARRDADADRPWQENQRRAASIRADWTEGTVDPRAASELLAVLREGSPGEAGDRVVELLNRKVSPASVWDALFLDAGELLMRQPGIVGVHCVTSANALYYAYQASGNDETRRLMMLQAAAFLAMFRASMLGRGKLREDLCLDTLEAAETEGRGDQAIEEVFATVSSDRLLAARQTLGLLRVGATDPTRLITAARRLVFTKGTNSHDYKFSSAALEDYHHATPAWRDRFLATSMFFLRGARDPDNDLAGRTRAALGA